MATRAKSKSPVVQGKEVLVTPKLAEEMLTRNTLNRPIHQHGIDKYSRLIKSGAWEMTGEPIIIASDGTLLDGQHRLWAIIDAETPAPMFIVKNVNKESFHHIDQGIGRTAADVFSIQDIPNAKTVTSALRRIIFDLFHGGSSRGTSITPKELLELYREHEDIQGSVPYGNLTVNQLSLFPRAYGVAYHYMMSHVNPERANRFFKCLRTGEFEGGMTTVKALRDRLFTALVRQRGNALTNTEKGAIFIRAWEAWTRGRSIRILRWNSGDPYPKITKLPRAFVRSFKIENM